MIDVKLTRCDIWFIRKILQRFSCKTDNAMEKKQAEEVFAYLFECERLHDELWNLEDEAQSREDQKWGDRTNEEN